MVEQIIKCLMQFIISLIQTTGYVGIFILLAAESAMIPITSLITLPFIGFMVAKGSFNIFLAIIVAALGSLTGAIMSFSLGYFGKDKLAREIIKKYGKYVLISIHDLDTAEQWFRKYGDKIILAARLIPVVKMFISFPAGMAKMKPIKFITFTLFGSLVWASIMIYLGTIFGNNWSQLYVFFKKFEPFVILVFVGLFGFYIYHKWNKLHHNKVE